MMQSIVSSYLHHQESHILPLLSGCRRVLDFGCGDMALDELLVSHVNYLRITGVDVVGFSSPKNRQLHFQVYKEGGLPFKDKSFDAVFAYHVFHHTGNPHKSLMECARVAKHRIIIVEPVLRHSFEKIGFAVMDFLTNVWKKEQVPTPYHVRTLVWWKKEFRNLHLSVKEIRSVGILPRFLPIGETKLFVLTKKRV